MEQKKALTVSALFTSALNLSSLSFLPEYAAIISACSPALQKTLEAALSNMGASRMSNKEKQRVGQTIAEAISVADANIKAGLSIKQKDLVGKDPEALIETICREVADDAQELKELAYASLIGNFAFQDKFNMGALYTLSRLLKELSIDELLLIAALHGREATNYEPVYNSLLNEEDQIAGELVNHFMTLRNHGITVRTYPFTTNHTLGNIRLSAYGEGLFELADLGHLDEVGCTSLKELLDSYLKQDNLA